MNTKIRTKIARSLTARLVGLSIILLVAVTAAASAGEVPKIAGQRLADAAERYDASSWPMGPARAGLAVMDLSFDGFIGGPVGFHPDSPAIRRFADEDGLDRFLVEVSVRETADQARTVLIEYLASVSSPGAVPTAAALGMAVGDVAFVGRAPQKRIAWVAFLRGTVAVRVVCLDPQADPHPEMAAIAGAIDRLILDQPLAADSPVGRIAVTSFTAGRQDCSAGDVVPLQLRVNDAPVAIHWVVGGPGQGYVEQDHKGVWQLHTTREGAIDLTCHLLGPQGFTASAGLTLTVGVE